MKNDQNIEITSAPSATAGEEKKSTFPSKGLLVCLLAGAIVLALLAGVLGVFAFVDFDKDDPTGGTGGGGSTNSAFSYADSIITDYIKLTEAMITGLTVPGYESRVDEVTDENVKKYINQLLLSAALSAAEEAGTALPKKTVAINYADQVHVYIIDVKDHATGESVTVEYFKNAYASAAPLQIGMEALGKAFDDALIGLIPMHTGKFETRTMGSVSATDTILMNYTVTETIKATEEDKEDTEKTHRDQTAERIDLTEKSDAFVAALLGAYGTIGQTFSFEFTEDADGDGDEETVTYKGVISSVIVDEETYLLEGIKLPDEYFGRNPSDEDYAALNGATLDFYINIDYTVPLSAKTWEDMTVADMNNSVLAALAQSVGKEDLSVPSDKSKDEAAARAYCLETVKTELLASYDDTVKSVKISLIWEYLFETLAFDKLPEEEVKKAKDGVIDELEYYYEYYKSSISGFESTYPNIEKYAPDFFGYDKTEYDSYEDFATYYAESSVKQQLLYYGIYNNYIDDEEALTARVNEMIDEVIEASTTTDKDGKTEAPTREEVLDYYGAATLRYYALVEAVQDYLVEKNTVDFTLTEK
ncbi:MAG: hypothetical protein IJV96_06980 [Clostridia bacterium]|nr:hypothetical protein [Clostridia bacterium]